MSGYQLLPRHGRHFFHRDPVVPLPPLTLAGVHLLNVAVELRVGQARIEFVSLQRLSSATHRPGNLIPARAPALPAIILESTGDGSYLVMCPSGPLQNFPATRGSRGRLVRTWSEPRVAGRGRSIIPSP